MLGVVKIAEDVVVLVLLVDVVLLVVLWLDNGIVRLAF